MPADPPGTTGRREVRRPAVVFAIAVAGIGALCWLAWVASASARHNAAVGDVVTDVSALDEGLRFRDVDAAMHAFTSGEDVEGAELDRLLAIGTTTPAEAGRVHNGIVAKYDVATSHKSSCVISVLKPTGFRVEAVSKPCSSGYVSPDLFRYMNGN